VQVDAFAMGGYASPRAFGHGGALSSFAFTDPEHALVAVVQTNGMCGNDDHYRRLADVMEAVYVDLGLAVEGAPRREKPMPQVSFAGAPAR
jgi:CubicO group peptidase (beta-lactamase class C family)